MKKCPECQRYSDDAAGSCDCGYNFGTGKVSPEFREARSINAAWRGLHLWAAGMAFFASLVVVPTVLEHFGGLERWARQIGWMMLGSAIFGYGLSGMIRGPVEGLQIAEKKRRWILVVLGVVYALVAFIAAAFAVLLG